MSKLLIVYWTGTGNTEIMAEKIKEGAESNGAEVELRRVDEVDASIVEDYDLIALGCPSMGNEELEESEFQPFFDDIKDDLSGKTIALFGSYGWGSGEWMEEWVEEVLDAGANVFNGEGFILNETPDEEGEEECIEFGKELVK